MTLVSDGRIPSCAILAPLYICAIISLKAAGAPDISSPTSNPLIPNCFIAPSMVSPLAPLTVTVAPIFFAISRRKGLISVTTIFFAPENRHMPAAMVPMSPAPVMSTSSPNRGKASAVWVAFPNGSMMAAKSSGISGLTRTTLDSGMVTYSAKHPSFPMIPTEMVFSHTCPIPLRQLRQCPQTICPSAVTRSPTLKLRTPGPTSATTPTNSCPMVYGGTQCDCDHSSHLYICRSVPQIAALVTLISTSLTPTSGIGTSSIQMPGSAYFLTNAFIYLSTIWLFRFQHSKFCANLDKGCDTFI